MQRDEMIETKSIVEERPIQVPRVTYRLQFHPGFTFADAEKLIGYLHDLGISDVYASPLLTPRTGSTHGYDIVDHSQINPALGGEDGLAALSSSLRERGMGLVIDVVPNHMGIGEENAWWMDVLENGPSSIYANFFDIDWSPVRSDMDEKVLLPILGDQYGDVLERGELRLSFQDGAFWISYYDVRLPVAPRTYQSILNYPLQQLAEQLGEGHPHLEELYSILTALRYLPQRLHLEPEKIAERNREKEIIKRRLATLAQNSEAVRAAIEDTVAVFNGTPGQPASFDLLDTLLEAQPYRPAFWRVAAEEINYRRFFDINELAAIRVELPEVFDATHEVIFRLLGEGVVSGLRIDHPDGLLDPAAYFRQLQSRYAELTAKHADGPQQLYIVAEKILAQNEHLRRDWQVAGTTGYDFMNHANGLFVDVGHGPAFDTIYQRYLGTPINYSNLVNANKKMIMLVSLASEIGELSHQLERLAERNRRYRDFTLGSLTFAMREVFACLPVYRTYLSGPDTTTAEDQAALGTAIAEAKRRNPRTAAAIFDFIHETLLLRNLQRFAEADAERLLAFTGKFQQLSGPVMAKGVEDTAFYIYNRLISLNEVGGHPNHFGTPPEAFHSHNAYMQQHWPNTMLSSSTHDTKRSEDVRARLNVLSELPEAWEHALQHWGPHGEFVMVEGSPAPERNDIYLLYQSILGSWPLEQLGDEQLGGHDLDAPWRLEYIQRIGDYMQKATKEAKQRTSWINPNNAYDSAMRDFVEATLRAPLPDPVRWLLRHMAFYGQFNALSQILLKFTAPGMPDIYQGNEMWDFSLVDPDNRRPVDYELRIEALRDLRANPEPLELVQQLVEASADGRIKLYLTERTLQFRREHAALFQQGSYEPLEAVGIKAPNVCAFARAHAGERMLVVVPRLLVGLTSGQLQPPTGALWQDTWLPIPGAKPGQRFQNIFSGETLRIAKHSPVGKQDPSGPGLALANILGHFPVALLRRID